MFNHPTSHVKCYFMGASHFRTHPSDDHQEVILRSPDHRNLSCGPSVSASINSCLLSWPHWDWPWWPETPKPPEKLRPSKAGAANYDAEHTLMSMDFGSTGPWNQLQSGTDGYQCLAKSHLHFVQFVRSFFLPAGFQVIASISTHFLVQLKAELNTFAQPNHPACQVSITTGLIIIWLSDDATLNVSWHWLTAHSEAGPAPALLEPYGFSEWHFSTAISAWGCSVTWIWHDLTVWTGPE